MGLRRKKKLKTRLAKSQPVRVAGSRPQGPVGQVSRNHQTSQITIFRKPPGGSLAKAWVSAETAASEVGTWRETKPGYPPPHFGAVREKGRGFFTLSAFGNHPTRPPRSADPLIGPPQNPI